MLAFAKLFKSLKARIIVSALLMVLILLPIVGFTLVNAYQKHMMAGIKNELTAYSYSILAVAEFEQQQLIMPQVLAENLFNINQSGLYASIYDTSDQQALWQSQSLLSIELPRQLPAPTVGNSQFQSLDLDGSEHFIYSFSVSFGDDKQSNTITLHIIKEKAQFQQLMSEFQQQLALGLLVLSLILLSLQFIWLRWSLYPLSHLKQEIADVEQGKSDKLCAQYPLELQQVKEQLNTLLVTEQKQRARYRNALSDLAHSLKTPLAVLQGQISTNEVKNSQEQIDVMNMMIEHQLKRAQSAGHSSWYLGVTIAPVLQKLINSLQKIYRDKSLQFAINIDEDVIFKGDEADLLEILGNLLDNACKAAKEQISLTIVKDESLTIIIEDDGEGIAKDKVKDIVKRGKRADTYQQGHGIGLAIVYDLVESYQGHLVISHSEHLGGARFSLTF